jgi:hypothetical protein
VDPEYDPSDFLMSRPKSNYEPRDRGVDDSNVDDASQSAVQEFVGVPEHLEEEMLMEHQEQELEPNEVAGNIDADLAISDSDDEQQLDENNDGLYF